jgi:L-2-hydroxycarboxylate dehydrogenase (NAD+)
MTMIKLDSIVAVSKEILVAVGVRKQDAEYIAKTIRYANLLGLYTHGIGRVPLYVKNIRANTLVPDTNMPVVQEEGAMALIDAGNGFGQVAAGKAIDIGVRKAKEYVVSAVGVRNSNNIGTLGFFGRSAAEEGMICLVFANAAPAVAPPGGFCPIFGTNPLCVALPGSGHEPPIVFDMATTVAARGKIRLAAKNGVKIPLDWAVDAKGQPTDDPHEALKGTLLPIGGYKGFGLSLMVDVLAGMLTGAAFGGAVRQLSDTSAPSKSGNLFIFMDPSKFLGEEGYQKRLDQLLNNVRACCKEGDLYLPGDSYTKKLQDNVQAVTLPEVQITEINELAKSLGLAVRLQRETGD